METKGLTKNGQKEEKCETRKVDGPELGHRGQGVSVWWRRVEVRGGRRGGRLFQQVESGGASPDT